MFLRRFLLALGGLALLAGVALTALWLKAPLPPARRAATVEQETVLVAERTIARGTLLRPADLGWRKIPRDEVGSGALIRGRALEDTLLGAAARRAFRAGEPLSADAFVRPGEPGFLPAVLRPGMRAVAIQVGLAEGGAGLIMPGDHVDVVLTQKFDEPHLRRGLRTVGETVLRDLRVLAIDRNIQATAQPATPSTGFAGSPPPGVPKTVTLEVTARQARELMVAGRIGELQLALRGASETIGKRRPEQPVWAADVSPALRMISGEAALPPPAASPVSPSSAASPSSPSSAPLSPALSSAAARNTTLTIMRGSKIEWRCFDPAGRPLLDCSSTLAMPGPPPPGNRAAPNAGGVAASGVAPAS